MRNLNLSPYHAEQQRRILETTPPYSSQDTAAEISRRADYRLLLVEDERDLQAALTEYLRHEGYEVVACSRGDEAVPTFRSHGPFDLILLDIMLPGMNGYTVLEHLRGEAVDTPVIVLTARSDHPDVMRGFDAGADDYVAKPFSASLLQARIRAILSRSKQPAEQPMDVHEFGQMHVNFSANEVRRNGRPVEFTALEYELLRYLINHKGRVVNRDQLLRDVWNLPSDVHTRTVDRHIASLRKKIEPDDEAPRHIHTVYGRGYRFEM